MAVAGDKLSAKEAALIALARQPAQSAAPARNESPAPAAAAASADPAQRIVALMEAARAEHQRERQRLRKFYVWLPLAFISVLGLCTLAWLWAKI
jgi:hypothetical protein